MTTHILQKSELLDDLKLLDQDLPICVFDKDWNGWPIVAIETGNQFHITIAKQMPYMTVAQFLAYFTKGNVTIDGPIDVVDYRKTRSWVIDPETPVVYPYSNRFSVGIMVDGIISTEV